MKSTFKLFTLSAILIFIYACQGTYNIPGYVPPATNSGTNSSGSLLLKLVTLHGADTNDVSEYSYNTNNQVITQYLVDYSQGQKQANYYAITRNNSGYITQFSIQTTVNGLASAAPVIHYVHYPSGSNNFDYVTSSAIVNGSLFKDSINYTFANNLVSKAIEYVSNGATYAKAATYEYGYDGTGNNTSIKLTVEGTPQSIVNYTFSYDNKVNPLNSLGNDNVLLTGYGVKKNNFLTTAANDANPTPSSFSINSTYTYTYTSSGYPSKATSTVVTKNPDSVMNYTSYYFYK